MARMPDYPLIVTPAPTDILLTEQGGITKHTTRAQIHALESGEHLVLPQVNEPLTPTLVLDGSASGFYAPSTNVIGLSTNGVLRYNFGGGSIQGNAGGSFELENEVASATNPVFAFRGTPGTGMGQVSANVGCLIGNSVNVMQFGEAAAAPLMGFFGTAAIAKPTGVAVTAAGVHAALVTLGLIAA